ncbi:MAG: glycosyltransferase [Clostridiales bacterium]|nr:glycosyltransferase [Clostridiales bacterium]
MKKVSVVLPVYNAEKYIAKCLDSLCKQTYTNLEIIIVDDGSTDNSAKICSDYRDDDKRVFLYCPGDNNVSYARNYALGKISGEYVTFIDADDWCEKTYMEDLVASIEGNDADISISEYFEHVKGKRIKRNLSDFDSSLTDKKNGINNLLAFFAERNIFAACWGKMYKTCIVKENDILFSERAIVNGDILFNMHYLLFCKKASFVYKGLYNYIKYSSSLSAKRENDAISIIDIVYEEKMRILSKSSLSSDEINLRLSHWKLRMTAFAAYREITTKSYIPFSERYKNILDIMSSVRNQLSSEDIDFTRIRIKTRWFLRLSPLINKWTLPIVILPIYLISIFKRRWDNS